jgi:hypothetical protein
MCTLQLQLCDHVCHGRQKIVISKKQAAFTCVDFFCIDKILGMRKYRHQRMRLTEGIVLGEPQNGIEKFWKVSIVQKKLYHYKHHHYATVFTFAPLITLYGIFKDVHR